MFLEKPVTPQKDKESVQSDSAENNQEGTLSPEKTQVLLSKKESKKTPIEDSKVLVLGQCKTYFTI